MKSITFYYEMLCFSCTAVWQSEHCRMGNTAERSRWMKELDYGRMGMRIRQVRKARGWSQEELAKRCGISMSFLGHIERGTRIMSLETFVNICGALDAGADEILWGVAIASDTILHLWKPSDQVVKQDAKTAGKKDADSYSMYVKIMKSVAEIMNEAQDVNAGS